MFVRDSLTASMALQQNTGPTWLGAIGDPESDLLSDPVIQAGAEPYLNAIRAIAEPMGLLRQKLQAETDTIMQNVGNADYTFPDGAFDQYLLDLSQMTLYTQQLPQAIAAFKQSSTYKNDASVANELHNWLAFCLDWLGSTVAAVPQAILNFPTTVTQYASGQIQAMIDAMLAALKKAEGAGLSLLAPLVIGGVALFALVLTGARKAETTRTYRKYVA